jgi:DNA-binding CsgD family transcriptional regulator/tetratricopeptide (TPR) repeat protein
MGGAVNAAARIAARAGGGEVLVSDVVRQLVAGSPAVAFRDRGRHRLRGFTDRWHLWAVEDRSVMRPSLATIGRAWEIEVIDELVTATAKGEGRFLLVEGEAGIGKTHLMREVARRADECGVTVVEVAADELVRRSGALAHGLLAVSGGRGLARDRLAAALEPTQHGLGIDLGFAVVEASTDLVEDLARDRALVVIGEDLHWGDELSSAVFAAIARRCAVSRFSLIGTTRPTPRPPTIDRLIESCRAGHGHHLRIGALDPVDVNALASAVTGAAPGPSLRQRLDATGGNPLYVRELLRCLDDGSALQITDGVAEVDPVAPLGGLHETLVRRLSWLPGETNEVLRYASLLGTAFTLHDVATVMGRNVVEIAGWLRDASLAGLITGEADRLAFRHDLIREAVYGHLPAAERRDLHRAAGSALARSGADSRQVAEQFARGARPGDREAIVWLRRAADDVASVSPAGAVDLLDRAIALVPEGWPDRVELQARSVYPLVLSGRFDEAITRGQWVLAAAPDIADSYLALRGLGAAFGDSGNLDTSLSYLRRAADHDGAPPGDARLIRCVLAQMELMRGHSTATEAKANADAALAHMGDDVTLRCAALQSLGIAAAVEGHYQLARDHLSEAVALIDSGRVTPGAYLVPGAMLAWSLVELDALDAAATAAMTARETAERRGAIAAVPICIATTTIALIYAGRWDDGLTEIDAAVELCNEIGSPAWIIVACALRASIALHRGRISDAETHLAEGFDRLLKTGPTLGADSLIEAQIELLAAKGDIDGAHSLARTLWEQTSNVRYALGHRQRAAHAVRLAMLSDDIDFATEVTEVLEEGARRTPASSAIATALRCRGLLERKPDLIIAAADQYRQTPRRLELARCGEDAAAVKAKSGDRQEAIRLLDEPAAIYLELDAAGDITRIDDTLRSLGAPRRRRRAPRPTFGWESLTPTELTVAKLAAAGLTNPAIGQNLYISRRTVEAHLSSVYRKVNVTNRTMLVAALAAHTNTEAN